MSLSERQRSIAVYLLAQKARRDRALQYIDRQYIVTKPGQDFHNLQGKAKILRGPNQAGKTIIGARETIYHLLGWHPYQVLPKAPVEGKIVTYSFPQGMKAQRVLKQMLPPWELSPDTHWHPDKGFRDGIIRLQNGSVCTIQTDTQALLAHSSDTLDFVWFDEPPSAGKYGENQARISVRNGYIWITLTPIGRPVTWLKDEVEAGKIAEVHFGLTPANVPFITPERIDEIIAGYLEEERDQRAYGAWEGVSPERKFTQFKPDLYVIDDTGLPSSNCAIYTGNDHGEKTNSEYFLILAVYQAPNKRGVIVPHLIALAEYTGEAGAHPEQDAEGVSQLLKTLGLQLTDISYSRADTNSAGKLSGGRSVNKILEGAFANLVGRDDPPFPIYKPDKSKGSVIGGTRRINNAFRDGTLKVHERCKQLIHSLRYWDGGDDDNKHAIDALRYISNDFLTDTTTAKLRIT